eukprot:m.429943 g.429943  ORF g.429943 m.429943 type:complete len:216 (+) comp17094_c0_seq1:112-759(+)
MASLLRGVARTGIRAAQMSTPAIGAVVPQRTFMDTSTGRTGFYAAAGAGALVALSQEVLILHGESVVAAWLGFVVYKLHQKVGPAAAEFFDDRASGMLETMSAGKTAEVEDLNAQLAEAKAVPAQLEGIKDMFEISRELNDMSRELAYRQEVHAVRAAAVSELDNFLKVENEVRAQEQADLVANIHAAVLEGLKGKEKDILAQCVTDLEALAASR